MIVIIPAPRECSQFSSAQWLIKSFDSNANISIMLAYAFSLRSENFIAALKYKTLHPHHQFYFGVKKNDKSWNDTVSNKLTGATTVVDLLLSSIFLLLPRL